MIDPKMVELTPYDGIPHLVRPVVTNPIDAAGCCWGGRAHGAPLQDDEQVGAKNLDQYNAKMRQVDEAELPFMIIIIDELADLMITCPKEVESAIMRLAQMARATGMHLVLATQRPSVDILTSLIKVNVPARIAFAVSSGHDSRTILDRMGAERLTGMGDMLFYQPGLAKPIRLQGPYISEEESPASPRSCAARSSKTTSWRPTAPTSTVESRPAAPATTSPIWISVILCCVRPRPSASRKGRAAYRACNAACPSVMPEPEN